MQCEHPIKIKPPLLGTPKETVAALKAQLEMELKNIKQCAYKSYECTQLTLDGYHYCLRHILQDKAAPYKQCAYVYTTNGKRCHLPTPKDKKDTTGYCNEHALKTHLISSKRGSRCQPPRTAEVLLHSVSHYIKKPRSRTMSGSSTQQLDEGPSSTPDENEDGLVTKSLDPFVDYDSNSILASGSDILSMCSESESDVDATSYGSVWHDAQGESSDNESIDSEQEDVLKHANVYASDEVTLITRDKLIRLQSLYIDHFRYLTHVLRERRRRYLYALKREKETCCSIYNQVHDSPKEQRLYKKLKAYNSYHKKHGVEAICHKRLHERRLKATEGLNLKPPTYSKCIFTEGGVKCGERALPVTRHCRKHILEDPNQVLFRACSKMCGDIECATPIEAIFDDATCRLHLDVPPIRSFSQIRKDSESDYDESLEHSVLPPSSEVPSTSEIPELKVEVNEPTLDESSTDTTAATVHPKDEMDVPDALESSSNFMADSTQVEMNEFISKDLAKKEFECGRRGYYSGQDETNDCMNLSDIMDVSAISHPTDDNIDKAADESTLTASEISSIQNAMESNETSAMEVCEEVFTEDNAEICALEKSSVNECTSTSEIKHDDNPIIELDVQTEMKSNDQEEKLDNQ